MQRQPGVEAPLADHQVRCPPNPTSWPTPAVFLLAQGNTPHNKLRYSVWRPLKGPLYDWPLAVCDAQTFTRSRDSQSADAVYPESVYENVLVHHHPSQQWYYFPGLLETETMLFKCTDSDTTASGRKSHFLLPLSLHLPHVPR